MTLILKEFKKYGRRVCIRVRLAGGYFKQHCDNKDVFEITYKVSKRLVI